MPKLPKLPGWVWLAIAGVVIYVSMGGSKGGIHMPNFNLPNLSAGGGSGSSDGGYQSNPGFSHSSH